MRAMGTLLFVCIALAVVKAAVAALLLALAIALIRALCKYPREVFGFVTYCAIIGLVSNHPWAFVVLAGSIVAAATRKPP